MYLNHLAGREALSEELFTSPAPSQKAEEPVTTAWPAFDQPASVAAPQIPSRPVAAAQLPPVQSIQSSVPPVSLQIFSLDNDFLKQDFYNPLAHFAIAESMITVE